MSDSYTIFEAGSLEKWKDFKFEIPDVGSAPKCFLKDAMDLKAIEISLNSFKPGAGMPFMHHHRENEELYIFLQGTGEFQAGKDILPIKAGTCVRCDPSLPRAWRNTGSDEMLFIVIQSPMQKIEGSNINDGELSEENLLW